MAIALERPAAIAWPAVRSLPRGLQWLFPDWRDVLAALAIVLGLWVSNTFGVLALADDLDGDFARRFAWSNLADTSQWTIVAYLAARCSAGWSATGWRRHLAVAALVGGALLVIAAAKIAFGEPDPVAMKFGVDVTSPAISLSIAALWFPLGLLLAAQFQRSHQERAVTGRLKHALREQQAAQRRFALAQLQALQSRIDPRFLFDMLEHVRRAYESDPPRAEALLEALIVFLRTVLPRVHSDASTLGREADIAGQYSRLVSAVQPTAGELQVTLPAGLADQSFPPGVLLPLVSDLLRQGGTSGGVIELAATIAADGCELTLHSARAPQAAALALVRAALEQTYGDANAVQVLSRPDGVLVTLRLADDRV